MDKFSGDNSDDDGGDQSSIYSTLLQEFLQFQKTSSTTCQPEALSSTSAMAGQTISGRAASEGENKESIPDFLSRPKLVRNDVEISRMDPQSASLSNQDQMQIFGQLNNCEGIPNSHLGQPDSVVGSSISFDQAHQQYSICDIPSSDPSVEPSCGTSSDFEIFEPSSTAVSSFHREQLSVGILSSHQAQSSLHIQNGDQDYSVETDETNTSAASSDSFDEYLMSIISLESKVDQASYESSLQSNQLVASESTFGGDTPGQKFCGEEISIKPCLAPADKQLFESDECCSKELTSESPSTSHVIISHMEVKPFKCSACDAKFSQKSALKYHYMSVHKDKRPFDCKKCDKIFSRHDVLKSHIRIFHEGKNSFICDTCRKIFATKYHLKRHLRSIHPGLIY